MIRFDQKASSNFRRMIVLGIAAAAPVFAVTVPRGIADEVRLKNGMVIEGKPVPLMGMDLKAIQTLKKSPTSVYPVLMIDTGIARYFVPEKQKVEVNRASGLASRFEKFKIDRLRSARSLGPTVMGSFLSVTDFDKYGVRTVRVKTDRGEISIVEGVKEIGPKYLWLEGINYVWEHGIATSDVHPGQLDAMIREITDQSDPQIRLSIARFYLQAGMYLRAGNEIDQIIRSFPDYKARCEQIGLQIRQQLALSMLREVRVRVLSGQHQLAQIALHKFPQRALNATVLRTVGELKNDYAMKRANGVRVKLLLGELQAELDEETRAKVSPMRSEIRDSLSFNSLERLNAFLKLVDDTQLSAAEKLALAYSGWVLGSAHAITELPEAINLWTARYLVSEYLRTENPVDEKRLLSELERLEGVDASRLLLMIPQLPPALGSNGITAGRAGAVEFRTSATEQAKYSVLLPREYNPDRSYPMVVALRSGGSTAERTLAWWGGTAERPGQSQRLGYIVIAPHYGQPDQRNYEYDATMHTDVLASIRDARKRFSVDSDRVFIAGHGMGGDAAFDLGMSKPHLFAGVVAICGICDGYCKWYWNNAENLPFYIVGGELDRDSMSRNATVLNRMMMRGFRYDVVYAEYLGRGFESYTSEREKIFDWMADRTRVKWVKEFEHQVLRPTENAFYWLEAFGLPRAIVAPRAIAKNGRPVGSPVIFSAQIKPGNTIYVRTGAAKHTVWLSPELINIDERVRVSVKGRQKYNDFVKPNIADILRDLKRRGDRQKVFSIRLEV